MELNCRAFEFSELLVHGAIGVLQVPFLKDTRHFNKIYYIK